MFKLKTGERDFAAQSWLCEANTVALGTVIPIEPKLRADWVLLVEVLEDYKFLEVVTERLNRSEKIVVI